MLTIQLDMLQTAALAMILFLIGRFTVSHVAFFQRCCIPAPVIGGLIFAILHLVTYQTGILTFTFDETLKTAFMDFFFTSVGFGASIKLLKKGAHPGHHSEPGGRGPVRFVRPGRPPGPVHELHPPGGRPRHLRLFRSPV